MVETNMTIPKSFAKDLKTKLYDSSAIKQAQEYEKLTTEDLYSRKVSNGVFHSPVAIRNKPMWIQHYEKVRAFSPENPTYARTTIFDDGKVKFQSLRSNYKN